MLLFQTTSSKTSHQILYPPHTAQRSFNVQSCRQTRYREWGRYRYLSSCSSLLRLLLNQSSCIVDASGRNRLSKRELDYGDSAWPLYSMYSNIAQQDDNMLADRCQRDTNGTMVFVSPHVTSYDRTHQLVNTDRSLRCHCRYISCGLNPRPQAKLPTCLCVLPCAFIPGFR